MIVPQFMMATPLAVAVIVYFLRRWPWVQAIVAAATAAVLALLALQIPLDHVAVFAGRDVAFTGVWTVLGRSFTFASDDRPALAFIYLASMFFFAGAGAAKTSRTFAPVGLLMLSLLAATIFVQPFLFAALFLEMIAAAAALMLADDDHPDTRGAMRLLVFVTLAVPFILMAGWQLEGVATSPDDPTLLIRATGLLNIGFMILLAIVPFHAWIPTVADDSSPFAAAFVFTVVQTAVMFFMLKFFSQYEWLRTNPNEFALLRVAGTVMVVAGGAFAFAQRRMGRLMGYAVMIDTGASLLAVGLGTPDALRAALLIVALRGAGLAVWGLGLNWLSAHTGATDLDDLAGKAWQMPFATAAVSVGVLSLAGFPLTAGFAGRWALYRLLAPGNIGLALALLLASASVGLASARTMVALFRGGGQRAEGAEGLLANFSIQEGQVAVVMLAIGVLGLLLVGLFPQWILPAVSKAAEAFKVLSQ